MQKHKMKRLYERYKGTALLALALFMIILGLVSGQQFVVLRKAVTICLECIGIG